MKQTVYFVPFSESGLGNKLFAPFSNPKANVPPFGVMKKFLEDHGFEVRTIDFWPAPRPVRQNFSDGGSIGEGGDKKSNDVIIVFDHPPVGLYKFLYRLRNAVRGKDSFPIKNRRLLEILPHFKRKILMQWESPVNMPWVYKNIKSIVAHYDESYFIPKASGTRHFQYPQNFNCLNQKHFDAPRKKFMVMMNSYSTAKGFFKQELYSKRVEALKFFAQYDEIDLYGGRWEAETSPVIKKIWKRFADDKPATMAAYTFALCFENAAWPGYVTEKIFDCMAVGTIPVYWGAPDIEEDVPADCFIDARKFAAGRTVDYGELGKFLHAVTPAEIQKYKDAMRTYFESAEFKKFTPEYFSEAVLRVIQ